jgi:dTDP-4-amino-4,6-dideoxy-D-glucose ammonia-lyase
MSKNIFKKWLYKEYSSDIPQDIKNILLEEKIPQDRIISASKIVHYLSEMPWYSQKNLLQDTGLSKSELIKLNKIIHDSDFLQRMIVFEGLGRKYWNTMLSHIKSGNIEKVINYEYSLPLRLTLFPGMSCMYYCGFCGRNQKAKYNPKEVIESGTQKFKNAIASLPKGSTISISGGLEPLTNVKLGEIITYGKNLGYKIPLITNAHMLTPNYLKRQEGIWDLDSLRVSLYGTDEDSTFHVTRHPKAYKLVKNNIIEFIKERNRRNSNLKIGLNYIIIPENIDTILPLLDYINEIHDKVDNGPGIDFLTIREDFGSVTEIKDDVDKSVEGRKYFLEGFLSEKQRKNLINIFNKFNKRKLIECPDMHVDYGYAMVALGEGILGKPLARVKGTGMRKSGYPQLSVAMDSHGDIFLYKEAGFLDRPGNEKFVAGRVTEGNSIESVFKNFIQNKKEINLEESDDRFMDSYDHLITLLVNQAEEDINEGIPFELGPVKLRSKKYYGVNTNLSNNWYKDESN